MIHFKDITKVYKGNFWSPPFPALDRVSFGLGKGRVTGFVGDNGAGKTTSLKIMLGLIKPSSGQVTYDPNLGKNWNEIKGNIGYLPERPYFSPEVVAQDFLDYIAQLTSLEKNTYRERLELWGERLKIKHALKLRLKSFSKGMLQRVGLLQLLIYDPKLIIMDEPLSGLDPEGREEFKRIFREMNQGGKTLFFSTHVLSDLSELCDEVIALDKGKVIYQGGAGEFKRP